jgi:putative SOS response-associated peptidase YedK
MCLRFTYKVTWEEVRALYGLTTEPTPHVFQPRYAVDPPATIDAIVVADGKRELISARWGLVPSWWNRPLKDFSHWTFNARAETVATNSIFRGPYGRYRCLIPVSGYYEWHRMPDGEGAQPWYFTARNGSPVLTIAGLWDKWRDKQSGQTITSCTIIITKPNKFAAEVCDHRMPALLKEERFDSWLSGKLGVNILRPAPEEMLQKWPVSKRVTGSQAPDDDPTLIEPITL